MNQYESMSLPCLGCEGQLGSYLPCELPGEPKLEVEALEPQRQRVVRTHPRAVGGLPLWLQCHGYSSAHSWDLVGFSAVCSLDSKFLASGNDMQCMQSQLS